MIIVYQNLCSNSIQGLEIIQCPKIYIYEGSCVNQGQTELQPVYLIPNCPISQQFYFSAPIPLFSLLSQTGFLYPISPFLLKWKKVTFNCKCLSPWFLGSFFLYKNLLLCPKFFLNNLHWFSFLKLSAMRMCHYYKDLVPNFFLLFLNQIT